MLTLVCNHSLQGENKKRPIPSLTTIYDCYDSKRYGIKQDMA